MTYRISVLLAALALVCAGCSAPSVATPGQPIAGGPDQPKFGGVLNTAGSLTSGGELNDFDMSYQGKTGDNVSGHGLVYDGLLRFKKGPEVEYVSQVLEPELAERWEVSPDAKTYTFHLRKGVKFAKVAPVNGRELTAADVKWSLEYYSRTGEFKDKKPLSQMEAVYEGLEAIETPDRTTVRVRFKEAYVPFVNYAASEWMPIAAKEIYEADGNLSSRLVGTGPFMLDLENSQKGSRWVFKKNPDYWDAPKPYLDSIRRLIIPDGSTQQAAFLVKQLDMLIPADFNSAQDIKKNNPEAVMFEFVNPGYTGVYLSLKRGGAMADVRVRKAISLAMDRDEFNKVFSGSKGAWALTGSWPGLFTDAEARQMLRYDPEEAKKLLVEAGYANNLVLENIVTPDVANSIRVQLTIAQLKRVGIETKLTTLAREQHRPRLYTGDFDIYNLSGAGATGDGDFDSFLYSYHSGSGQNWSVIKDPELDRLAVAQRQEADPQKRREVQRAAVRRINDMAYNPSFIFPSSAEFWHPYVKNYRPHYTIGEEDAFIWLDK